MNLTPIREYEQACYIYWLGPNLPTVKIGMSNEPARRLEEFRRETGTPGHLAAFAAIVWLDRGMGRVERAAHTAAHTFRRDGEWFELPATEALNYVVAAAESLGIRYEVEDRAGVWAATLARREAERRAELIRRIGDRLDVELPAIMLMVPDPDEDQRMMSTAPSDGYKVHAYYLDMESAERALAAYNANPDRPWTDRANSRDAHFYSGEDGYYFYPTDFTIDQAWLNSEWAADHVTIDTLETWAEKAEAERRAAMVERARQIEANRAAAHAEYLARQAERDAAAAERDAIMRAEYLARQATLQAAAEREAAAAAARHAANVAKFSKNRRTLFGRIFG